MPKPLLVGYNTGNELFLSVNLKEKLNFTINLFTVTNSHLATFEEVEGVEGDNIIPLSLPANPPKGSYIISLSSEKGTFYSKFIQI